MFPHFRMFCALPLERLGRFTVFGFLSMCAFVALHISFLSHFCLGSNPAIAALPQRLGAALVATMVRHNAPAPGFGRNPHRCFPPHFSLKHSIFYLFASSVF